MTVSVFELFKIGIGPSSSHIAALGRTIRTIDASRLAMMGDGSHMVSLDKVIETMRQTGLDMRDKYKETSKGGLAVNLAQC